MRMWPNTSTSYCFLSSPHSTPLSRIPLATPTAASVEIGFGVSGEFIKGHNSNLVRLRTLRHETFRFSFVSTITHISMFKEFQYTLYKQKSTTTTARQKKCNPE